MNTDLNLSLTSPSSVNAVAISGDIDQGVDLLVGLHQPPPGSKKSTREDGVVGYAPSGCGDE